MCSTNEGPVRSSIALATRRAIAVSVFCTALAGWVSAAGGETDIFRDTLRPNGIERSHEEKMADGRACGAKADGTYTNVAAFETCMRARGWAYDHSKPDASDKPGATFDDVRGDPNGRPRGNAALRADTRKCDPLGNADQASQQYQQCMLSLGWRYSFTVAGAAPKASKGARVPAAATARSVLANPGDFIDPETGLSCHNAGFVSICVPPNGTVKYINKHGLNCTRTGAASFCSNF